MILLARLTGKRMIRPQNNRVRFGTVPMTFPKRHLLNKLLNYHSDSMVTNFFCTKQSKLDLISSDICERDTMRLVTSRQCKTEKRKQKER